MRLTCKYVTSSEHVAELIRLSFFAAYARTTGLEAPPKCSATI